MFRVKWSPDGKMFATASHDKTVGIYEFNEASLEVTFVKQLYFVGAVEAIQFTSVCSDWDLLLLCLRR
jgi:hypothetical protein